MYLLHEYISTGIVDIADRSEVLRVQRGHKQKPFGRRHVLRNSTKFANGTEETMF